jgi:hypothetical protein
MPLPEKSYKKLLNILIGFLPHIVNNAATEDYFLVSLKIE